MSRLRCQVSLLYRTIYVAKIVSSALSATSTIASTLVNTPNALEITACWGAIKKPVSADERAFRRSSSAVTTLEPASVGSSEQSATVAIEKSGLRLQIRSQLRLSRFPFLFAFLRFLGFLECAPTI